MRYIGVHWAVTLHFINLERPSVCQIFTDVYFTLFLKFSATFPYLLWIFRSMPIAVHFIIVNLVLPYYSISFGVLCKSTGNSIPYHNYYQHNKNTTNNILPPHNSISWCFNPIPPRVGVFLLSLLFSIVKIRLKSIFWRGWFGPVKNFTTPCIIDGR